MHCSCFTTTVGFIRLALEQALRQYQVRRLEERDENGYTAIPVRPIEAEEWLTEQDWGDEWNGEFCMADGMKIECAANFYNMQTVPKGMIGAWIATLSATNLI